jgi:hypothetical protein
MKRIILSCLLTVIALIFFGCDESGRIDQIDDSIPAPKQVEVTRVTRIPGGSVIRVKIPDDDNLKGVVAKYERNGEIVNTKISRYLDSLVIEGYADTLDHVVQVSAFNVNEVTSAPVNVTITPLPAVVQIVNFDIVEAFGGIKIHVMDNTTRADLAVCLLADKDTTNINLPDRSKRWVEVTTLFTASEDIFLPRRGLQDVKTIFGVYIRDRWGNKSDTLVKVLKPLQEIKLDKKNFKYFNPGDDNSFSTNSASYPIEGLWDDSGHSSAPHFYASTSSNPMPQWFTIDLGVRAKLSRIGKMARIDYAIWTGAHPREYEFWGSMAPTGVANPNNEHGFDNSWFKLGSFEQPRPSGYNPDGTVPASYTAEDREMFNTGTEFEMDNTLEEHAYDELRYLRVVIVNTFATWETKATVGQIQLGEVTPFGQVLEVYSN